MDAEVSIIALPVLAVIGILVFGAIVGVVALLANPKTRAAGAAVLAIGLLVLLVGGLVVFFLAVGYRQVAYRERSATVAELTDRAQMDAIRAAEDYERRAAEGEVAEGEAVESDPGSEATIPLDAPAGDAPAGDAPEEPSAGTQTPGEEEPPPDNDASSEEKKPAAAEARPEWVDQPPQVVGGVYQVAIKTDPLRDRAECEIRLRGKLNEAISAFARTELKQGREVAGRVQLPLTYVRRNIVQEEWPEPVTTSWGEWMQLHALLKVDQEARKQIEGECGQVEQQIEKQRQQASVMRRLWYSGTGVGVILAVLAVVFACLKIDQVTERPCRGRLTLGAIGLLLAVALAAYLAVGIAERPPEEFRSVDWTVVNLVDSAPAEHGDLERSPPMARNRVAVGVVALPLALLLLGGIVTVVAYKKTRVIGLVLLVVVVVGALPLLLYIHVLS